MIDTLIQVLLVLSLPPLLQGVIVKTKARFAGRIGAPLLQSYFDLFKLVRKQMVLSRTTTWAFLAGPAVALVTTAAAALLLPLSGGSAPLHFPGDPILFVALLALGRFFTTTAAFDTGSAFAGMGATRDLTFACLAEPVLLLGFMALAKATGSLQLSGMLGGDLADAWSTAAPTLVMVVVGLIVVVLAENARIPVDDPNTHLELTMIHEAMVLDHSGPALAAVAYAAAMKLFVMGAIVARLVVPLATGTAALDWIVFVAAMLGFAIVVGTVESVMARLRLLLVPNLLIGAGVLTGFGLVFLFVA